MDTRRRTEVREIDGLMLEIVISKGVPSVVRNAAFDVAVIRPLDGRKMTADVRLHRMKEDRPHWRASAMWFADRRYQEEMSDPMSFDEALAVARQYVERFSA